MDPKDNRPVGRSGRSEPGAGPPRSPVADLTTFEQIRSLAAGFQPAKLLLSALDLGVFDVLADEALDAEALAARLELDPRATRIAANALVALGLLEKENGRYVASGPARRWLARCSPDYRGDILRHLHHTWRDWQDLERVWRAGRPAVRHGTQHLPRSDEEVRNFICGMENVTRDLAPRLAELVPLEGVRKGLDLGAGPGNYCLAFVNRWPGLRMVHFDLPATSRIARQFVAGKPGAERIAFREGDFLRDPLGGPYGFVWASQVVHMLGEADVRRLLGRVCRALEPGGVLAVHDQFLDPGGTSPRQAALFGVHMLVVTDSGRTYTCEEVETWAQGEGFTPAGRIEYGGPARVVLLRKEG